MMAPQEIVEALHALELELLAPATRQNSERLQAILADHFREFGSSGRVYSKSEILAELAQESPASITLSNFEVMLLSPDVALVTYESQRHQPELSPGLSPVRARRSSLWMLESAGWQIVFHQGTSIPGKAISG